MKIGIIGDPHLGASFSLGTKDPITQINSRLLDYQTTLLSAIKSLHIHDAKHLVITGDIFESRNPSLKQQELFSTAIHQAKQLFESIHIVIGNHDQQRSLGSTTLAYLKELYVPNVYVYDDIDHVEINNIRLIFLPYRDRNYFKDSNKKAIENIRELIDLHTDGTRPNYLIGHMAVEGTLHMMEVYSDLYDGNEIALPIAMFDRMKMVIMGHIHTPGYIAPNIYYIGSMEKRGAFEKETKSAVLLDTDTAKITTIPLPCRQIIEHKISIHKVQNDNVNTLVMEALDKINIPKGAIVKLDVDLPEEDQAYFKADLIEEHLLQKHQTAYCRPIKTNPIMVRTAKDAQITEDSHEIDALRRYIESNFSRFPYVDELMAAGLEILK